MNTLKIIVFSLAMLTSYVIFGQEKHNNEPSRNIKKYDKLVKLNNIYFEETQLLKTYFKTGEIKNNFPGYNYALSQRENALEIKKWLEIKENQLSLTPKGLLAIDKYIKKK